MHVPHLSLVFLKFSTPSDHIIEQVPQLRLNEETPQSLPVIYLHLKYVREIVVTQLY